jgi:hypothetical protein
MQSNIFKKIRLLSLLSLPFALATSAFAQSLPTVSANPNQLDFGSIPVNGINTIGTSIEVEVTNTSQEDLILFASPTVESVSHLRGGLVNAVVDADPNSNNNPNLLKPGGKGRARIECSPLVVGDIDAGIEIKGTTSTNATARKFATIPVKCTGVASQRSRRFSLKLAGADIDDVVDVQVKDSIQRVVKQLKCKTNLGNKFPAANCDLQVAQGLKIEVKSNSSNFARFINATGSAQCQAKVCTFNLTEDSTVTASFKPTVSLPPVNK